MFFILSKLLRSLTSPLTWIIILFLYSLFTKSISRKTILRKVSIVMLLFFTNPLIANLMMDRWEMSPVSYDAMKKHKYAVLLTGVTSMNKPPYDRTHFNKGADRVIHTIDLYKKGLVEKIVVTGGIGSIFITRYTEAENIQTILKQSGIPAVDIILETKARNTAENALYTKELIEKNVSVILITSAFHMRRSIACFNKIGIEVTPFPTDLYSIPYSWTPDDWLIPKSSALTNWDILIKEWIGFIAYKVKGYA